MKETLIYLFVISIPIVVTIGVVKIIIHDFNRRKCKHFCACCKYKNECDIPKFEREE